MTIYNLGEIRVTAPPGGYVLDAVATEGHITMDDGDLKPSEGSDPHVTGADPRRRSDAHAPHHARRHHGAESLRANNLVRSLQFAVYSSRFTVYSSPCSPLPPFSRRPSPI